MTTSPTFNDTPGDKALPVAYYLLVVMGPPALARGETVASTALPIAFLFTAHCFVTLLLPLVASLPFSMCSGRGAYCCVQMMQTLSRVGVQRGGGERESALLLQTFQPPALGCVDLTARPHLCLRGQDLVPCHSWQAGMQAPPASLPHRAACA